MNYLKWHIYLHFRFLAHNGHWKNYNPRATPPPKGNSNFVFANGGFRRVLGVRSFGRGVSSFVLRLKNNKLWRSRCFGESLGERELFCKYDSAAALPRRRDCRSRADARTHGRAHSRVFLLLDVPISHALHRSRCSRCFRRPFALGFSAFIDFSQTCFWFVTGAAAERRIAYLLSISLSLSLWCMCIVREVTLPGFVIIAAVRISLSGPAFVSVPCSWVRGAMQCGARKKDQE